MVVAVVICGNRTTEALVMIKSAIVFRGNSDLRIVVIAEKKIQQGLDEIVSVLKCNVTDIHLKCLTCLVVTRMEIVNKRFVFIRDTQYYLSSRAR